MTTPTPPEEQPAPERKWRYNSDVAPAQVSIPARDLTIEEFDALTEEQQKAIRESPLYELDDAPKKAPSASIPPPAHG